MLQFSTVAFVHYSYFAFNCFSAICDFNLAFYNHILYLSLAYQLYFKKKTFLALGFAIYIYN